jgi:hypothetical protein
MANETAGAMANSADDDEDEDQPIPPAVFRATGARAEDIQMFRGFGFDVDDNNDPAEENIPDRSEINGVGATSSTGATAVADPNKAK